MVVKLDSRELLEGLRKDGQLAGRDNELNRVLVGHAADELRNLGVRAELLPSSCRELCPL